MRSTVLACLLLLAACPGLDPAVDGSDPASGLSAGTWSATIDLGQTEEPEPATATFVATRVLAASGATQLDR